MNKKAGFTDIFLFIIMTFVFVLVFGIYIYIGNQAEEKIHESLDNLVIAENLNTSETIDSTIGKVNESYQALYWIAIFLIGGMMLSILIGSYIVTTKPVFFIPYVFIVAIAVVVSVGISNAYGQIIATPLLASTFDGFVGANFILAMLPMWTSIIGFVGGIILFTRMGSKEERMYYG